MCASYYTGKCVNIAFNFLIIMKSSDIVERTRRSQRDPNFSSKDVRRFCWLMRSVVAQALFRKYLAPNVCYKATSSLKYSLII